MTIMLAESPVSDSPVPERLASERPAATHGQSRWRLPVCGWTLGALGLACAAGAAQAQLELVWADEFNGTTLNPDNWEILIGTGVAYGLPAGWGNNEAQFYTSRPENVRVENGNLIITAIEESFAGQPYTSARIRTLGKADFLYGRFEGRIKLPSGRRMWPAFWMMPTDSVYGIWAASGEIDIMESVNLADRVYGTIHYGGSFPANTSTGQSIVPGPDLSQDFHVYAFEWGPDQIRWYFGGQLYSTLTREIWRSDTALSDPNAPFDQVFHFILNVAVGGGFPDANPTGPFNFPDTMEVDYLRAYQFTQEPYLGAPAAIPGVIEAEHFDTGYGDIAYQDSDGPNNGGALREGAVDVQTATVGGFNVGFIRENEWIEYTVDVQTAGTYRVEVLTATPNGGGTFALEFDGVDKTGDVTVPFTGGWQAWSNVETTVQLDAGVQVMRFVNTGPSDRYNLNRFEFSLIEPLSCGPADTTTSGLPNGVPDGVVNLSDFSYYLSVWAASDLEADLTSDGVCAPGSGDSSVTLSDFSCYLSVWSSGCP